MTLRDSYGRDMSADLDRYITGNYGEDSVDHEYERVWEKLYDQLGREPTDEEVKKHIEDSTCRECGEQLRDPGSGELQCPQCDLGWW